MVSELTPVPELGPVPELAPAPEPVAGPTLTLFCGPPGAGKTTLARRLEAEGHGIRLSTDDWEHRIAGAFGDDAFHDRLQRALFEHAQALLRAGVDVILEDGLWSAAERAEKFAVARACGARIAFHVFDVPTAVLHARLRHRNAAAPLGAHPVTVDELDRAIAVFEPPTAADLDAVDAVEIHRPTAG